MIDDDRETGGTDRLASDTHGRQAQVAAQPLWRAIIGSARVLAMIVPLAAVASMVSPAAGQDNDHDRLRKILEEKFGGAPDAKSESDAASGEVYIVKPDGSVVRQEEGEDDGSSGDQSRLIVPRAAPPDDGAAHKAFSGALVGSAYAQTRVDRGVIVIQFDPSASELDIESLIEKYDLKVVKSVPALGVIYVRAPGVEGEESAEAKSSSGNIGDLLEPPIVLQLRDEPAVNAAFIDTTVSPKSLPSPVATSVAMDSRILSWNWLTDAKDDGNWGAKLMRMPAVWTIIGNHRRQNPNSRPPSIGVLDSGFGANESLAYSRVIGGAPIAPLLADCRHSHGTHVAGIIAAHAGGGKGIDGLVPNALLDAIPISRELLTAGTIDQASRSQLHLAFFMDAITDLAKYFDEAPLQPGERRIVNVSLSYNWSWVAALTNSDPVSDRVIRDQIRQHAKVVQYLVDRVRSQVLFVAAAGNDSADLPQPFPAVLASPFGFAALDTSPRFKQSTNVLIVEGSDRRGARAAFSNAGGHVSAPSVDIISTFASATTPFGVCEGTSQAAPHATALAAILMELAPALKPAEIIEVIRASALPSMRTGDAPRIDALAAVLKVAPGAVRAIADLNGDGAVDAQDLAVFRDDLLDVQAGRFGGTIERDLNGDGVVDGNERCYPRIDLNGSGRASFDAGDERDMGGTPMSDLEVMELAWTDTAETFPAALQASGLDSLTDVWIGTSFVSFLSPSRTLPACH